MEINDQSLSSETEQKKSFLDLESWISKPSQGKKWSEVENEETSKNNPLVNMDCLKSGFHVESGRNRVVYETQKQGTYRIENENERPYYRLFFFGREHENYVGKIESFGTFLLSVESAGSSVGGRKALLRTKKSNERLVIPSVKCSSKKEILRYVQANSKDLSAFTKTPVTWTVINNAEQLLDEFEQKEIRKKYKFGILYCNGDQNEEEMFSNAKGSEAFDQFLEFLGKRVKLEGFTGFSGGLDTKSNSTGLESVYTKLHNIEIMFHVSTLLPFQANDLQRVERKRHLGNDAVILIFRENATKPLDPRVITSHFNHNFFIIHPEVSQKNNQKITRYRLAVANKANVDPFSPFVPDPPLFEPDSNFRNFLLTKMINAERASFNGGEFRTKLIHTKAMQLEELGQKCIAANKMVAKNLVFSINSSSSNKEKASIAIPLQPTTPSVDVTSFFKKTGILSLFNSKEKKKSTKDNKENKENVTSPSSPLKTQMISTTNNNNNNNLNTNNIITNNNNNLAKTSVVPLIKKELSGKLSKAISSPNASISDFSLPTLNKMNSRSFLFKKSIDDLEASLHSSNVNLSSLTNSTTTTVTTRSRAHSTSKSFPAPTPPTTPIVSVNDFPFVLHRLMSLSQQQLILENNNNNSNNNSSNNVDSNNNNSNNNSGEPVVVKLRENLASSQEKRDTKKHRKPLQKKRPETAPSHGNSTVSLVTEKPGFIMEEIINISPSNSENNNSLEDRKNLSSAQGDNKVGFISEFGDQTEVVWSLEENEKNENFQNSFSETSSLSESENENQEEEEEFEVENQVKIFLDYEQAEEIQVIAGEEEENGDFISDLKMKKEMQEIEEKQKIFLEKFGRHPPTPPPPQIDAFKKQTISSSKENNNTNNNNNSNSSFALRSQAVLEQTKRLQIEEKRNRRKSAPVGAFSPILPKPLSEAMTCQNNNFNNDTSINNNNHFNNHSNNSGYPLEMTPVSVILTNNKPSPSVLVQPERMENKDLSSSSEFVKKSLTPVKEESENERENEKKTKKKEKKEKKKKNLESSLSAQKSSLLHIAQNNQMILQSQQK